MSNERVVIAGAAGRDFHDFIVVFRDEPRVDVVAFTATQIPGIADRHLPASIAGPRYPTGIPIVAEDELERLIRDEGVTAVVFSYSDVSHEQVMHLASRALAAGADFRLLGPDRTMLRSRRPVVAVCAARTGSGKSQTSRRIAALLEAQGMRVVVVRHPMPYGDLAAQRVQRFATHQDLDLHRTTIEEREEYEPHLDAGRVVYAGVDYGAILHAAEGEADVILWDGGNNDLPFYRPDLHVVVVDPLRPGHELRFHPGETNLRMADLVVINKIDSAEPGAVEDVRQGIAQVNPGAAVVEARSALSLVGGEITGRTVVVVEDGPTLTHGGMPFGAGIVAARRFGAARIADPAPHAVGSIAEVLGRYPALEPLVPAMGYSDAQIHDLAATLDATPADVVLAATPIDLSRVMTLARPVVRVRYELEETEATPLEPHLQPIVDRVTAERAADLVGAGPAS